MKQRQLFPDTDKNGPEADGPYWEALYRHDFISSADDLRDTLHLEHRMKMKNEMTITRPLRFISARAAIILLCLVAGVTACMVPVETTEPVGKVVTFRVPAQDASSIFAIKAAFQGRKRSLVEKTSADGSTSLTYLLPGAQESEVERLLTSLENNPSVQDLKVRTLSATVRESLASSILYRVFHTHIDARNMTDDELKQSIEQQLAQAGLSGFNVQIRHNPGVGRVFEIKPSASNTDDFSVDVTVDDQGGRVREVMRRQNAPGNPGIRPVPRTDQDIKDMVKADHADLNLTDDEIQIERNGDEVTVTINKDGKELKLKLIHKQEQVQSH